MYTFLSAYSCDWHIWNGATRAYPYDVVKMDKCWVWSLHPVTALSHAESSGCFSSVCSPEKDMNVVCSSLSLRSAQQRASSEGSWCRAARPLLWDVRSQELTGLLGQGVMHSWSCVWDLNLGPSIQAPYPALFILRQGLTNLPRLHSSWGSFSLSLLSCWDYKHVSLYLAHSQVFCFVAFWGRILLCYAGWSQTWTHNNPLASASQVLWLKACSTMPGFLKYFKCCQIVRQSGFAKLYSYHLCLTTTWCFPDFWVFPVQQHQVALVVLILGVMS